MESESVYTSELDFWWFRKVFCHHPSAILMHKLIRIGGVSGSTMDPDWNFLWKTWAPLGLELRMENFGTLGLSLPKIPPSPPRTETSHGELCFVKTIAVSPRGSRLIPQVHTACFCCCCYHSHRTFTRLEAALTCLISILICLFFNASKCVQPQDSLCWRSFIIHRSILWQESIPIGCIPTAP